MDTIATPLKTLPGLAPTQSETQQAREPGQAGCRLSSAHLAILRVLAAEAVRTHCTPARSPKMSV
ncbi:hypothetical protein GALL_231640 [mine drainage metagenome]|uniref:Uncharacterized protein n=1 Tax=mine drainage metagenome TaxID=410659 RepID=A0A1J5RGB4_9ZZZZ